MLTFENGKDPDEIPYSAYIWLILAELVFIRGILYMPSRMLAVFYSVHNCIV